MNLEILDMIRKVGKKMAIILKTPLAKRIMPYQELMLQEIQEKRKEQRNWEE